MLIKQGILVVRGVPSSPGAIRVLQIYVGLGSAWRPYRWSFASTSDSATDLLFRR